jgi:hypothetical protein
MTVDDAEKGGSVHCPGSRPFDQPHSASKVEYLDAFSDSEFLCFHGCNFPHKPQLFGIKTFVALIIATGFRSTAMGNTEVSFTRTAKTDRDDAASRTRRYPAILRRQRDVPEYVVTVVAEVRAGLDFLTVSATALRACQRLVRHAVPP